VTAHISKLVAELEKRVVYAKIVDFSDAGIGTALPHSRMVRHRYPPGGLGQQVIYSARRRFESPLRHLAQYLLRRDCDPVAYAGFVRRF
jgi:hypothetical protein